MTVQQKARLDEIVWVDPDRMSGEPCFKGTRVPVQALIDHIEGNSTLEDFLKAFPSVTREQAIRFIELAKENLLACLSVEEDWLAETREEIAAEVQEGWDAARKGELIDQAQVRANLQKKKEEWLAQSHQP